MKKTLVLLLAVIASNVFSENTIIAIVNNSPITLNSIQNKILTSSSYEEKIEILNTCLLYTSPSPRDRTRSRMPSSA